MRVMGAFHYRAAVRRASGTRRAVPSSDLVMAEASFDRFDRAIALTRVSADEHELVVHEGWQQGRGAFGGVALGAALDAMVADEPDRARLPRAFQGEICGPVVPGRARLRTRVLRRGNNQSNLACDVVQGDQVVTHASCVLSAARAVKNAPRLTVPPPAPPPFADVPVVVPASFGGPVFTQHYEYRSVTPLPRSGEGDGSQVGWIRERVPLPKVTHAVLLARLDAFWPAIFAMEGQFRPIATVSFMAELFVDPSTLDPSEPLHYRARCVAEAGGYVLETRELWRGDEPVAFNQQSIAIIA